MTEITLHARPEERPTVSEDRILTIGTIALQQVSKLSALAAGAAVLAFAQGSLFYRSYLMELGARWAQPVISSASLLRAGGTLVAVVFVVAAMTLALTATLRISAHKLGKVQSGLSGLACICLFVPLMPRTWTNAAVLTGAGIGASALWAIAAGAAIAFVMTLIAGDEGEGSNVRAILGAFLTVPMGIFVPVIAGQQMAREDLDPERTQLPYVSFQSSTAEKWRLVFIEDKNALLVALPVDGGSKQFRLIDGSSLESIASTSPSQEASARRTSNDP